MRELKFRAYHKGNCEMLQNNQQGYEGNVFQWLHERQPIDIMQYTGMKDKNRNDIFEGDVVKIWTASGIKYKAIVEFNDGCFDIVHECRDYLKVYVGNRSVEVIGNIHENPELLEQNNETNHE